MKRCAIIGLAIFCAIAILTAAPAPDYVADGPPAAYFGLMELAQRAIIAGLIGRPYTPARWLAWAKKYDHPISRIGANAFEHFRCAALRSGFRSGNQCERDPQTHTKTMTSLAYFCKI
jgi:hypothetical protein